MIRVDTMRALTSPRGMRSARTMACRLPAVMPSTASASWPSGGSGLGISIERIQLGNPQQNGRHERIMHLTLKKEATKPAGRNILQQQSRFDDFIEEFNHERPHQALDMQCPGEGYSMSAREYRTPDDPEYPMHDRTVQVAQCGRICMLNKKINFSKVFAGQLVDIKEVSDRIWLVSFMDYDLGYFDEDGDEWSPSRTPLPRKCYGSTS